jgi:hypothetical protein
MAPIFRPKDGGPIEPGDGSDTMQRPGRVLHNRDDEHDCACFTVRDGNGQAFAYVYCEEKPGRRAAAKLLRM